MKIVKFKSSSTFITLGLIWLLFLTTDQMLMSGEIPSDKSVQNLNDYRLENIRAITDGKIKFLKPKWSPDGKKIAISSGVQGIWLMDTNGNAQRNIIPKSDSVTDFLWLLDSKTIIYKQVEYKKEKSMVKNTYLKQVDIYNGNVETLRTSLNRFDLRITNDGNIFVRDIGRRSNEIFDTNGNIANIAKKEKIYFRDENRQLKSIQYPDRTEELLYDKKILDFKLNNKKNKIIFQEYGKTSLLNLADGSLKEITALSKLAGYYYWLPDDIHLITYIALDDGHRLTESDIYLFNMDTNILTNMTSTQKIFEMYPDLSPDGKRIVYCDFRTGIVFTADIINY